MIEIRFHGRGGQGAVKASDILAMAAFKEGKEVQSFPFFGVERRGAPVTAFTRISDEGDVCGHAMTRNLDDLQNNQQAVFGKTSHVLAVLAGIAGQ